MDDFLAIAFGSPTIVYTLLVFASLIYWMIGVAGLVNMDFGADGAMDAASGKLDGAVEAAGGKLDGAMEAAGGKLDGAMEAAGGKLDGAMEAAAGNVDGAAEGHADVDVDADAAGGFFGVLMSLLSALRLRHAPITITASVLFLFAWIFSYAASRLALPLLPGPAIVGELAVLVGALIPAVPLASAVTRPIGKLFAKNPARTKRHLLGHSGRVRISAATGENAQVRVRVGGDDLLLRVRSDVDLAKNAEVLLVDYDAENDTYLAEPMSNVLDGEDEKKRRA